MRSRISGSWTIFAISPCSFLTIASGVPAGAKRLVHSTTSNSGTPASIAVGISGMNAARFGEVTKPVAIAEPIADYVDALEQYLLLVDALVTAANGGVPPPAIATRKANALALAAAIAATKLEAA